MNNKLQGWQLAVSPRLKANFGSTGTTIFGYDFSKANQAGSDSFTPQSQAIILANQGLSYYNNLTSDTQNASQVNQSLYLIQRLPITSLLEASGGFRRQVQQASTSSTAIGSVNGTAISNQQYSANAGDVAVNANYSPGQRIYAKWNQSFRWAVTGQRWAQKLLRRFSNPELKMKLVITLPRDITTTPSTKLVEPEFC